MPEIQIRPAIASDIPILVALDHHYTSEHVWQLEVHNWREDSQVGEQLRIVNFRQVRLPRSVRVEYPRSSRLLASDWTNRSGILVALLEGQPIGYTSLMLNLVPRTTWVTDLVVDRPLRRQGIGSALILAALEWAANMDTQNLVIEMQPRELSNNPAGAEIKSNSADLNDRYAARALARIAGIAERGSGRETDEDVLAALYHALDCAEIALAPASRLHLSRPTPAQSG